MGKMNTKNRWKPAPFPGSKKGYAYCSSNERGRSFSEGDGFLGTSHYGWLRAVDWRRNPAGQMQKLGHSAVPSTAAGVADGRSFARPSSLGSLVPSGLMEQVWV